MNAKNVKPDPASASERASDADLRRIDVEDLLDGAREVILIHGGQNYRLRITSNGKLILTK